MKLMNENTRPANSDCPLTNMWWPQTKKPITAMAMLAPGDEFVAEQRLAREASHELAHHAHAGQNHYVDGGMRVEPEQMLEQERIAAEPRIEDAHAAERSSAISSSVIASTGVASTRITEVA